MSPLLDLAKMHQEKAFPKASPEKAFKLYKKIYYRSEGEGTKDAEGRSALALGRCFRDGLGVKANASQHVKWLVLSIEAGNAEAAYEFAMLHIPKTVIKETFGISMKATIPSPFSW